MSNPIDALVGRSVIASIGEPWDFESAAGKNRLEGVIVAVAPRNEATPWCLCTVSSFGDARRPITMVGAVRRYACEGEFLDVLAQGKTVGANFLYEPNGYVLTVTALREALRCRRGLKFLAGSLRVET